MNLNGALAKMLVSLRGRRIAALVHRGDRGDGFVHLGGRQFLAGLDVTCRDFNIRDNLSQMTGDVLLIYGAGTMAREVRALPELLASITPRFAEIILLPSSYDLNHSGVKAFSASWNEKYTVFCRELVSLDTVHRSRGKPRAVLLGHDLAFHADLSRLAERPASGRGGVFRHDGEAGNGRRPRDLDICADPARGADTKPDAFLEFIAALEELHTDRCHGAIAAAMMGRSVVFYPNCYFKNSAVYDHSLAAMPQVRFVERPPFSPVQFVRAQYWKAFARPITDSSSVAQVPDAA